MDKVPMVVPNKIAIKVLASIKPVAPNNSFLGK